MGDVQEDQVFTDRTSDFKDPNGISDNASEADSHMSAATFQSSLQQSSDMKYKTPQEDSKIQEKTVDSLIKHSAFIRDAISIEEIENQFYLLCKDFALIIHHPRFNLESLTLMHHLYQLLQVEDTLSEYERMKIYGDLNEINSAYPAAMEEYLWIERAIGIINHLSIKWGVIDFKLYNYRNSKWEPQDNLQRLEAANLRRNVFSMETLWFAHSSRQPPLNMIVSKKVSFLAVELQRQVLNLLKFMVKQNEHINYSTFPTIHDFLSIDPKNTNKLETGQEFTVVGKKTQLGKAVIPDSQKIVHIKKRTPDEKRLRYSKQKEVGFHLFEFPSFWCKCRERPYHTANFRLKEMLIDFEIIYRDFEQSFFKDYQYLGNFLKEERKMGMIAEQEFEEEGNYTYDNVDYNTWMNNEEGKIETQIDPVKTNLKNDEEIDGSVLSVFNSVSESLQTFEKIKT